MTPPIWQLQTPLSAIVFDCDGTLSAIEGIDELANLCGVGPAVQALTKTAMGQTGLNPTLYQQRLELVRPTQAQLQTLGQTYFKHQVPNVQSVIQILQRLNKVVYLVSAGLNPAVRIFGELLQIPHQNIFAVDVTFNAHGDYQHFDADSPLIHHNGKRSIVSQLKLQHPTILHIGDGMNDLVTYDLVTRFVGYGGAFYRENIAEKCAYYIHTLSMAPLLALALTQQETEALNTAEQIIYQQGLTAIFDRQVKVSQKEAATSAH